MNALESPPSPVVSSAADPIVRAINIITMNMTGRFKGREIKSFGDEILRNILIEKNVGVFFGQQLNFRPNLPAMYDMLGNGKAFLLYNKAEFRVNDEKQYRHYLKDLQHEGFLPQHYLCEQNYMVCKVRSRQPPKVEFIALTWVTDECLGPIKALGSYRKMSDFSAALTVVERLPVVLSGTFRLNTDELYGSLPAELRLHNYPVSTHPRKSKRATNHILTSYDMDADDVQALVCAKMDLEENNRPMLNFENAFYCDPVQATIYVAPKHKVKLIHGMGSDVSIQELNGMTSQEKLAVIEEKGGPCAKTAPPAGASSASWFAAWTTK